ncbi:bifunctional deaminase-reductase-like protein [Candidatus Koribacter versatilis Ellin345]|uniref:Bifunctional deaminase-reductase-like protein n=1 Tax=Koribacter versatilis (strain Ellin345) TaxID=204669 RepID=Q1INR8_KORVE|nr:dihydrofolate reductase family protein [Candidatus Koribacter versatilis]ABF41482.1 bifunctional deaminase-reductase-like protein [Candidatus Koribacter versatilis Ellin345]
MKISVFCGVSVDGFIARKSHTFDFLPEEPEPHGFEEFYKSIDTVVIGRNTYQVVVKYFPKWYYGKKRVVVLSSGKLDFSEAPKNAKLQQMSGEPAHILSKLKALRVKHVYLDGGITIQRFLAVGLVDRMTVTRVPVLIGEGIPLFGPVPGDIKLRHVKTKTFKSGLVTTEYDVLR